MLGNWLYAVFRDIIIRKRYDLIILFVEDRINRKSFLIGNYRDSSDHSTNWCFSSDASERSLHSTGLPGTSHTFFFLSFWVSWTQWRLKFSSSLLDLSFSYICPFWKLFWGLLGSKPEAVLIENNPDGNSEAFKRCSTRWTVNLLIFSCFETSISLKPSRNKLDISTFFAFIRRYLTFSNFLYT